MPPDSDGSEDKYTTTPCRLCNFIRISSSDVTAGCESSIAVSQLVPLRASLKITNSWSAGGERCASRASNAGDCANA